MISETTFNVKDSNTPSDQNHAHRQKKKEHIIIKSILSSFYSDSKMTECVSNYIVSTFINRSEKVKKVIAVWHIQKN